MDHSLSFTCSDDDDDCFWFKLGLSNPIYIHMRIPLSPTVYLLGITRTLTSFSDQRMQAVSSWDRVGGKRIESSSLLGFIFFPIQLCTVWLENDFNIHEAPFARFDSTFWLNFNLLYVLVHVFYLGILNTHVYLLSVLVIESTRSMSDEEGKRWRG